MNNCRVCGHSGNYIKSYPQAKIITPESDITIRNPVYGVSLYNVEDDKVSICPSCNTVYIKTSYNDLNSGTKDSQRVEKQENEKMRTGILEQAIELAKKHNTLTTIGIAAIIDQVVANGAVREAIKRTAGEAIGNILGTVVGAAAEAASKKSREKE